MTPWPSSALRATASPLVRRILAGALVVATAGAAAGRENDPVTVETTVVVSQKLTKSLRLPGDLTPYQAVDVYAKVSGFVESIAVDRGSVVTRGATLAVLTAPEVEAQGAEAQAKLESMRAQSTEAEAKTVAAQSTADRLRAASATPGVVAGHDLEIAQKTLDAARAHAEAVESSVTAAEAARASVAQMQSYLRLRAPFDGVVVERNVHPGSLVGPSGRSLLRIEQVTRLRLTVPVPEVHVASIEKGTVVEFRVAAFPDETFEATIARPAQSIDLETRSMAVELDVGNADLRLAPGMFAEVEWPISRSGATLFVPPSAVVRTSERQFVVRVRDGVAEWVDVRRGETSGDLLEVFGELQAGDVVVRRGNDEIRPGTAIAAR